MKFRDQEILDNLHREAELPLIDVDEWKDIHGDPQARWLEDACRARCTPSEGMQNLRRFFGLMTEVSIEEAIREFGGAAHIDYIADRTGLTIPEIVFAVFRGEVEGTLRRLPGQRVELLGANQGESNGG